MISLRDNIALLIGCFILIFALLAANANASLFSSPKKVNYDISIFPKWIEVLNKFSIERNGSYTCNHKDDGNCSEKNWDDFIKNQKNYKNKYDIINSVNKYINKVKYVSDISLWGKGDYWATPFQFMSKGGDCEDFAIAKFFMLREIGFSNDDLQIVVLYDENKEMMHSILLVNIEGQQYMLDNNKDEIFKSSDIKYYKPIYAINETNWWRYTI